MNEYFRESDIDRVDRDVEVFRQGWKELHRALELDSECEREVGVFANSKTQGRELAIERLGILEEAAAQKSPTLEVERPDINYRSIQKMFAVLEYSNLVQISHNIDFNLELREKFCPVNKESFPSLYFCFVSVPADKNHRLDKESDSNGYHIHYYSLRKDKRTDTAFTFNKYQVQPAKDNPKLYCYKHGVGKYLSSRPESFADRRRKAIYDGAKSFLSSTGISDFKTPPKKAFIFYPV